MYKFNTLKPFILNPTLSNSRSTHKIFCSSNSNNAHDHHLKEIRFTHQVHMVYGHALIERSALKRKILSYHMEEVSPTRLHALKHEDKTLKHGLASQS